MHFIQFILYLLGSQEYGTYTAKNQYRTFETHIPRKGTARPQSQFPHSRVCEQFLYSHDRSAYSAAGKYADRSWGYINRSQAHECGLWKLGLRRGAIPPEKEEINGIFVAVYSFLGMLSSVKNPAFRG